MRCLAKKGLLLGALAVTGFVVPQPTRRSALFSAVEGDETLRSLTAKVERRLLQQTWEVPGVTADFNLPRGAEMVPRKALKINLDILNWRAKRFTKRGKMRRARNLLLNCLEIDPLDGRAWLALSRDAERNLKNPVLAAEYLKEGLRRNGENAHLLQAFGFLYEKRGSRKRAMEQYDRALKVDPSHVASWVARGRLLDRRFRVNPMNKDLVRNEFMSPFDDEDQLRREFAVRSQADEADLEEARRCYEKALELDPKNEFALLTKAQFEQGCGYIDAARKLFERATKVNPHNSVTWTAWAQLEEKHRDTKIARKLYAMAHRAHPVNTRALTNWAKFEIEKMDNATGALELLRRASLVRMSPKPGQQMGCSDANVFRLKGELEWKHNSNPDEARNDFKRGIAVDATNPRCYLSWAEMEAALNRSVEAKKIIQQGIWGSADTTHDKWTITELWIAAAQYEAYTPQRLSERTISAAREAFRHAIGLITSPADIEDRPHHATKIYLAWVDFEERLPMPRRRSLAILEEAVKILPSQPELWHALACYMNTFKNIQAATAVLHRARIALGYPIHLGWSGANMDLFAPPKPKDDREKVRVRRRRLYFDNYSQRGNLADHAKRSPTDPWRSGNMRKLRPSEQLNYGGDSDRLRPRRGFVDD